MSETAAAMIPAVAVEAETRYVLGFPILVAVVLRNTAPDTDYLDLPQLGVLIPMSSVGIALEPVAGGHEVRIGPSFEFRDQNLFRTQLLAGQTKRMLIDLTQFGQPFAPGRYRLTVSVFGSSHVSRESAPVAVEFIEPTPPERDEAARLRRLGLPPNAVDSGSWSPFLTNNWHTVSAAPSIGAGALHQLALHLVLHRAAYGPEPLARFSLETLRTLTGPVLSPEAAAIEYEVFAARDNPSDRAAARSRALQAFRDLTATLDLIDNGEGLVHTLRRGYGVDRDPPLPPGPRPYTPPSTRS